MQLFKKQSLAYGGELLKTRAGRSRGRPIDTKNSMHLVLRSSKAKGAFSMRKPQHAQAIKNILTRFSLKYGIAIKTFANVGNHLHIHVLIRNRHTYKPFIRAVTAAIAMAVTGASRWRSSSLGKFWDYRPFTRVVAGYLANNTLTKYIEVNQWEGLGANRFLARQLLERCAKGFARAVSSGPTAISAYN